ILDIQLKNICKSGSIDELVFVLGYKADKVEARIQEWAESGMRVSTVYNPFFNISNNLISLWLARSRMLEDDFMIMNGDSIFPSHVFLDLVERAMPGFHISVARKPVYDDDDMKVSIRNGMVSRVSKDIAPGNIDAESVGLALVKGHCAREILVQILDIMVREEAYHNSYWLEVFNFMSKRGIAVQPWYLHETTKWMEVDCPMDLERLSNVLRNEPESLTRIEMDRLAA
ncbi:MAG: hypothetical protein ACPL7O_06530, partial [Armatimonadota bacterium]